MIRKERFDSTEAWVISDGGLTVRVLDYGCALQSIEVPTFGGKTVDVCLGYDRLKQYEESDGCFGAVVGRHANRLGGAEFELDGKTYLLAKNDGENNLHSAPDGFHTKRWEAAPAGESSVRFLRVSPDGEAGFPGALKVSVTYTVQADTLHILYEAVCNADTVINLTNHCYFNLNGHASGSVLGHLLQINADCITENDAASLPTGRYLDVKDTPFDFRTPTAVGARIDADDAQLCCGNGYDHNFILRGDGLRTAAILRGDKSGICMEVLTDQPGVQLYTANGLTERIGKDGAVYRRRCALCLETQHFPNAMQHPEFPSVVLRAGERFRSETAFRLYTKQENNP